MPIYDESRLAKLSLNEEQRAVIDDEFEEVTEQAEERRRERLKSKWAALEAISTFLRTDAPAPHRCSSHCDKALTLCFWQWHSCFT